jgi:hypothetical protein
LDGLGNPEGTDGVGVGLTEVAAQDECVTQGASWPIPTPMLQLVHVVVDAQLLGMGGSVATKIVGRFVGLTSELLEEVVNLDGSVKWGG